MCTTCGCSDLATPTVTDLASGKVTAIGGAAGSASEHDHGHAHVHHHHPGHHHDHPMHGHGPHDDHSGHHHHPVQDRPPEHNKGSAHHSRPQPAPGHFVARPTTTIALERAILEKNDTLAARNRGWFEGRQILALNLVSSPGAGKTSLLTRTIEELSDSIEISVVEGDQATLNDARRIEATGCRVVQVNTGTGCHLEADMLAHGLQSLKPPLQSVVMIENVGNLVCPALFDLGEFCKVAILSVTEGDDKPLKYPHMFRASRLMLLNKIDLLEHVDFDVERCIDYARQVNPEIEILQVSATRGQGLNDWYEWIGANLPWGSAQERAAGGDAAEE